jgi:outer membrane protein assembly factor BamA
MEGDKLFQGTFRMGGTVGESIISNPGNKYFYLRGFETNRFLGDKALLISGEYRFPIAYPQRFPGMLPIFFQKIHGALFADWGGVFDRKNRYPLTVSGTTLINPATGQPVYVEFKDEDEWNLGVGAELRVTGFLGWGMIAPPLTARFGVAHDIQGDGIGPVFYFDIGTPF